MASDTAGNDLSLLAELDERDNAFNFDFDLVAFRRSHLGKVLSFRRRACLLAVNRTSAED